MPDSDYNGRVELFKALRPSQFMFDRVATMNESHVAGGGADPIARRSWPAGRVMLAQPVLVALLMGLYATLFAFDMWAG